MDFCLVSQHTLSECILQSQWQFRVSARSLSRWPKGKTLRQAKSIGKKRPLDNPTGSIGFNYGERRWALPQY
jgi:hypothetical protein